MTLTLSTELTTEESEAAPSQRPLRELFDAHAPFVWRTLRYLGVPESDLPDVCQEVFLIVHQKVGSFEGRSSLETWIYGICVRAASGFRKRAYTRREIPVADPPEAQIEAHQTTDLEERRARELLARALDALDDDKRAVFVLFEIEERPMQEIADILGWPLRTTYGRLHAARAEMAAAWTRMTQDGGRR